MQDTCNFHAGGNQNGIHRDLIKMRETIAENVGKKICSHLTAEKEKVVYPLFPCDALVLQWLSAHFLIKHFWGCKEGGPLCKPRSSSLCCCRCHMVITGFWKLLNLLTFCWQQGGGLNSIGKTEEADLQWCLVILKLPLLWKLCELLWGTMEDRFCTGFCPAETFLHGR